jgi:glycosyltransferase involved in cell wall biosynthesis
MYLNKSVCVVIPAFNEEQLIGKVLETLPEAVDQVVVVDDASTDRTAQIVQSHQHAHRPLHMIQHPRNQGVGGAIVSGYRWALEKEFDIVVVMAGDAQMDPEDFVPIIAPIAEGRADYTKGDRLFYGKAWKMIPRYRYLGNAFLSLLTKFASGYWHVADSQSGYTAISRSALKRIDLERIYKRYGMPNDLLIALNMHDLRVCDVPVRPVYNVGETSGIRLRRVVPSISWILFKGFWRRLLLKYVVKDFHPLVFFYALSFMLILASFPLGVRLFYVWAVKGNIPDINAMALIFTLISGLQTLFFGMWFDMEYNKHLR